MTHSFMRFFALPLFAFICVSCGSSEKLSGARPKPKGEDDASPYHVPVAGVGDDCSGHYVALGVGLATPVPGLRRMADGSYAWRDVSLSFSEPPNSFSRSSGSSLSGESRPEKDVERCQRTLNALNNGAERWGGAMPLPEALTLSDSKLNPGDFIDHVNTLDIEFDPGTLPLSPAPLGEEGKKLFSVKIAKAKFTHTLSHPIDLNASMLWAPGEANAEVTCQGDFEIRVEKVRGVSSPDACLDAGGRPAGECLVGMPTGDKVARCTFVVRDLMLASPNLAAPEKVSFGGYLVPSGQQEPRFSLVIANVELK